MEEGSGALALGEDDIARVDPPGSYQRPTAAELQALVQRISERVARQLERKGWWVRDAESARLHTQLTDEEAAALEDLQSHSITHRIALGPHKGRKAFMLQSLAPRSADQPGEPVAQAAGFSLHAGVVAEAHERKKLERLSLTPQGNIERPRVVAKILEHLERASSPELALPPPRAPP